MGALERRIRRSMQRRKPPNRGVEKERQTRFLSDRVLLRFGRGVWTNGDACENTLILGSTGAGKSSGPAKAIAEAKLRAGWAIVVLATKYSDPYDWRRMCARTRRSRDLVMFGPNGPWRCNPLEVAARMAEAAGISPTEDIVQLLQDAMARGGQRRNSGPDGDFWERAQADLLRNAIDLIRLAKQVLCLRLLADVIRTSPRTTAEMERLRDLTHAVLRGTTPERRLTAFERCWIEAARIYEAGSRPVDEHSFIETVGYWAGAWPRVPERTQGSIVETFQALVSPLLRGDLAELFTTGTNLTPADILAGKVVVLNIPTKIYGEQGATAQAIMKFLCQKAFEQRSVPPDADVRPVCIWADEYHLVATPNDRVFASTCRGARASMVAITQNRASLVDQMGEAATENLTGNLQTRIFCQNETETNEWAAGQLGSDVRFRATIGPDGSVSCAETPDHIVRPIEFARLARGGEAFGGVVEAIVFKPGKTWGPNGENFVKVRFRQR